jgi:hypothetical protein
MEKKQLYLSPAQARMPEEKNDILSTNDVKNEFC